MLGTAIRTILPRIFHENSATFFSVRIFASRFNTTAIARTALIP